MAVQYRVFRGTFKTWETLFQQAASFASRLSPERLISISHSEDQNEGVVVVWYYTEDASGGAAVPTP